MLHSELATKQYAVLHVALEDLRQASFFAKHLQKKRWHRDPWEGRWPTYMHQSSYTTSLVVSYSRPFTPTRQGFKFPQKLLRVYNEEDVGLHWKILTLRNTVYAHTDLDLRSIRPIKIGKHTSAIEYLPPMKLFESEVIQILNMIQSISIKIIESMSALEHSINFDEC
jgi:hypothetical protein